MRNWKFIFATVCLLAGNTAAHSETNTIVVGFAAGGTSSTIARYLADALERMTGSTFIVENRKGAGGLVAADYVKRQKPDGKTLMLMSSTSSLAIAPSPAFTYIALVARYKYAFVTGKQNPATLNAYFTAAKQHDALRNVATAGAGTTPHLVAAELFEAKGIPMVHIPFPGSAPAILSVAGEQVASAVVPYPDLISQMDSVRVLAQTGDGLDEGGWIGILAPAGVPAEEVERLQTLFRTASGLSKERLERLGFEQAWEPGSLLRSLHESEYERFMPLLARLGIQLPGQ